MLLSAIKGIVEVYLWYCDSELFKRVFVGISIPADDSFFVCLFVGDLCVVKNRGPPISFISKITKWRKIT